MSNYRVFAFSSWLGKWCTLQTSVVLATGPTTNSDGFSSSVEMKLVLTFSLQIYIIVRGNMKIKHFGSIPGSGMGCVLCVQDHSACCPQIWSFLLLPTPASLACLISADWSLSSTSLWTSAQSQSSCAVSFKIRSKSLSENLHSAIL